MDIKTPRFLRRFSPIAAVLMAATAQLYAFEALTKEETIDQIALHEVELISQLGSFDSEIYIEQFDGSGVVRADHYWLGEGRIQKGRISTSEFVTRASRAFPQQKSRIVPEGFVNMLFPDLSSVDLEHYDWTDRGQEMLGDLKCLVYDLRPKPATGFGAFQGRVWVADGDLTIVRFDGTFTGPPKHASPYLHFVSVRVKAGPQGLWVPSAVYIDDKVFARQAQGVARLKARVNIWGIKKRTEAATMSSTLHPEEPGRQPEAEALARFREPQQFYAETEQKVLTFLEITGLIAPAGPVDRVPESVVGKLLANASDSFSRPIKCRILLSTPMEWVVVRDTILVPKSLLDAAPDEAGLASALAPAAAAVLRDRPIEAFSDETLQNREEALNKLNLQRPAKEIAIDDAKALELLGRSPFRPKLSNAAMFQRAAAQVCQQMQALFRPRLGNQLAACNPMSALRQLDPLVPRNPKGPAALPLNSRLVLDPWTGTVQMVDPPPDDAPFQIVPIDLTPRRVGEGHNDDPIFPPPVAGPRAPALRPLK